MLRILHFFKELKGVAQISMTHKQIDTHTNIATYRIIVKQVPND